MNGSIRRFSALGDGIAAGRTVLLACAFALAALSYGCGGSGGIEIASSVGSGGTGAAASGPISGFGSVILAGRRFDDSTARITLDDDAAAGSDLRLGMMVEIDGELGADGTTGRASSISGRSFVRGPIAALDVAANRLTVLGTQVLVTPETVFDGAGVSGLASLSNNQNVEVYGISDGGQGVLATRIERIAAVDVRLTGVAQNLTGNSLVINGVTVRFQPSLIGAQSGIANGALLRVKGTLQPNRDIAASSVLRISLFPSAAEGTLLDAEGVVTRFVSPADFDVNGQPVSAGGATRFDGAPTTGARVELEGIVRNGRVVATKVKVKNEQQVDNEANEVHGAITSVDLANRTFTMRNGSVTVKWDAGTVFQGLNASSLAPGRKVEVKGHVSGNALIAARIKED